MNLTQRQLRMFVTTAAVGNISRASEALHISQPALTRALQEFESQLGVALFLRTTRQLALTPEGERFLPVAQRLLHDLTEAAALIQGEATGQSGSVSLAVGEAFGCTVLPDILQSFVKKHPGVRVRVVNDNSQGITRRVAQGEVDFGIGSPVGRTEALRCTKLLSAPLGLLFNPQLHQLKAWVRTETLGDLPLLKEGSDTSIVSVLRAQGSDLVAHMDHGVEVSSLALQLAMARAGVGIAVMSALGASHRDAADLRFSPLRPTVQREVFVMQQRDRALSVPARALIEAVVAGAKGAQLHRLVKLES
ncbi:MULTISPECIES: LysR family transcriptional regulator [unclassified Acidovorax]|uniref:LysR family transcriptional regulator n=1 Tax=unclassified Acidovorax TaxID=2684926 RepID=UPI00070231CB|nr:MULTISPECIES: LysR family transcriptional regulator [unclassified Acidovorax]KQW24315.1 hypothetical protein ASC83_08930 [Acidovorax sp. Root402]KRA09644.1 hypothetical protein ASD75_09265 [Acidovorax sp. Root568]